MDIPIRIYPVEIHYDGTLIIPLFYSQVKTMMEGDEFDSALHAKVEGIFEMPQFAGLVAMGVKPESLQPVIKPFVIELGENIAPLLLRDLTDPAKVLRLVAMPPGNEE